MGMKVIIHDTALTTPDELAKKKRTKKKKEGEGRIDLDHAREPSRFTRPTFFLTHTVQRKTKKKERKKPLITHSRLSCAIKKKKSK